MSIDRRDFIKFGALGALAFAADPKELLGQDAGQIPNMAKQAKPITRDAPAVISVRCGMKLP